MEDVLLLLFFAQLNFRFFAFALASSSAAAILNLSKDVCYPNQSINRKSLSFAAFCSLSFLPFSLSVWVRSLLDRVAGRNWIFSDKHFLSLFRLLFIEVILMPGWWVSRDRAVKNFKNNFWNYSWHKYHFISVNPVILLLCFLTQRPSVISHVRVAKKKKKNTFWGKINKKYFEIRNWRMEENALELVQRS
jgi:hypothetical protein